MYLPKCHLQIEADPRCQLCDKSTMYKVDGFECRVCGKVFHKACLEKTGQYTHEEVAMVDRAFTNMGWSCAECVSCGTLFKLGSQGVLTKKYKY